MTIIKRAADCNIRTFISCRFDNDLQSLVKEGEPSQMELEIAWETILIEFLDMSGNEPEEVKKLKPLYALKCRNKVVELCMYTIKTMLNQFNEPMLEALPLLKQNGHNITWNNDIDNFRLQVSHCSTRENLHQVRLTELEAELKEWRAKQTKQNPTPSNERTQFYRLLNNLEAFGYKIDEEKTNVARFALMVKDYNEAHANKHPS